MGKDDPDELVENFVACIKTVEKKTIGFLIADVQRWTFNFDVHRLKRFGAHGV